MHFGVQGCVKFLLLIFSESQNQQQIQTVEGWAQVEPLSMSVVISGKFEFKIQNPQKLRVLQQQVISRYLHVHVC